MRFKQDYFEHAGGVIVIIFLLVVLYAPAIPFSNEVLGDYSWITNIISIVMVIVILRILYGLQKVDFLIAPPEPVQFLMLVLVVSAVCFAAVIIVCLGSSAILYNLSASGIPQIPFSREFSQWDSFIFFVDQAMKGLFFDLMEIFDIHLKSSFSFDAAKFPIFGAFLVLFRALVATLAISAVVSVFSGRERAKQNWKIMEFDGKKISVNIAYAKECFMKDAKFEEWLRKSFLQSGAADGPPR